MITKTDFLTADIAFEQQDGVNKRTLLLMPTNTHSRFALMYEAEKEVIKKRTRTLCKKYNPQKVLEIGFGLGYTATELQKNKIAEHTIVEAHPEIFKNAEKWAEKYPNVKLVNSFIQDYEYEEQDYDFILDDRLEIVHEYEKTPRYKVNDKWHIFYTKEDLKEISK
jgi:2-polyprenyl-3-methyl-5-hydroxy-6-metoxy-1,4-benzoquinol methylase